jgi:uncharacterized membrane protein YgcG
VAARLDPSPEPQPMSIATSAALAWHRREATWAILIALALVLGVTVAFFTGATRPASSTALTVLAMAGALAASGSARKWDAS